MAGIHKKSAAGFTLVELAVVLTIIGLLLAGILKGQELIRNARMKASIKLINEVSAAHTAFRDKYSQLPGDITTALTRISGCDPAMCRGGDGSSVIGNPTGYAIPQAGVPLADMPRIETTMYWKHLALTDLIGGVDPTSDPTAPAYGVTHPAAPFPGGIQMISHAEGPASGIPPQLRGAHYGHYIMFWTAFAKHIHFVAPGPLVYKEGEFAMSPGTVAAIDRKIDDGLILSGYVWAIGLGSCDAIGIAGGAFDERSDKKNCALYAHIGP